MSLLPIGLLCLSQRSPTVMGKDAKQTLLSSHDEEVEVVLGKASWQRLQEGSGNLSWHKLRWTQKEMMS